MIRLWQHRIRWKDSHDQSMPPDKPRTHAHSEQTPGSVSGRNAGLVNNSVMALAQNHVSNAEIMFEAQDGASPAWGTTSPNQNSNNFCFLVNTLLARNTLYAFRVSPKSRPPLGLLTSNKVHYAAPANQIFPMSLPCSFFLSYRSFLPSVPFFSSLKEDCVLHEVLNKLCSYHLNCLL